MSLASERGDGSVTHQFTPEGIVACLKFASNLKPSVDVRDVLEDALEVMFGPTCKFMQSIRDPSWRVPGLKLLRTSRVRLDMVAILYERQLQQKFKHLRYLLIDSSPQLGFNFLCIREDRIRIPKGVASDIHKRVDFDINSGFETRLAPLSTLGVGNSGLVKKGINTINVYLMETETADDFHMVRCEVKATTSDQGTEVGIGDDPICILDAFRDFDPGSSRSYMYPNSLQMVGHLHILFNALHACAKSLDFMPEFLEALKSLQDFLSKRGLRKKFQAGCLQGRQALWMFFNTYGVVHIDWKWEFLSKALDKLLPLFSHIQTHWDERKMLAGETTDSNSVTIKAVTQALRRCNDKAFGEMLRISGKGLEKIAHKLEGCWCHQDPGFLLGSILDRLFTGTEIIKHWYAYLYVHIVATALL